MSDKNRGLLLAFIGIMILSFDSLFVKLSNSTAWNVLFWRGAFQCIALVIFQLLYNRKKFTAEISSDLIITITRTRGYFCRLYHLLY